MKNKLDLNLWCLDFIFDAKQNKLDLNTSKKLDLNLEPTPSQWSPRETFYFQGV